MHSFVLDEGAWSVLKALEDRPQTSEELSSATGLPLAKVVHVLGRLANAGAVEKDGAVWRLKEKVFELLDLRNAEPITRVLARELAGLAKAIQAKRTATAMLGTLRLTPEERTELLEKVRDLQRWVAEHSEENRPGEPIEVLLALWET